MRVIEAVTAGVAFLAAGVIFRSGRNVKVPMIGAVWLAGAIGAARGVGYGIVAVLAAVLATIILAAVRRMDGAQKRRRKKRARQRQPRTAAMRGPAVTGIAATARWGWPRLLQWSPPLQPLPSYCGRG